MLRTFVALFLLAAPFGISAQFGERAKKIHPGTLPSLDSAQTKGIKYSWTVFAEALGLGGDGSLNLDVALLNPKRLSPHLRAGVWDERLTQSRTAPNTLVTLPVEAGLLIGKTHMLELNLGYVFELPVSDETYPGYWDYFTSVVGWVGYRYQRRDGGLFGKIGLSAPFTPTGSSNGSGVHVDSTSKLRMALGMGYTFK